MAILDYNFYVAVWVGFIALYGVAVETGVVMVIYLHEALDKKLIEKQADLRVPTESGRGNPADDTQNPLPTDSDIAQAAKDGAVLRLRPKVMTVAVNLIGLIP